MTPGRRLTVAARDHRGGALPLVRALADAGHQLVNPPAPADVLLIDLDAPLPSHRHLIELYRAAATLGRRRFARVDAPADAGALPHVRDATGC